MASLSELPASGQQLLVSEKFVSLQGEGASAGAPAAFLRLGNCNLDCTYCDTAYTWDSSRFDLQTELHREPIEALASWVTEHAPGRLIITGGEPLLQQKQLKVLLEASDARAAEGGRARLFVEVETNGTVRPLPFLLERIDQWNVSPKLGNAKVERARRIDARVLAALSQRGAYFKFVVSDAADVREVEELVEELSLSKDQVLLMPEASDVEQLRARGSRVANWAAARSFRYSGRLHLELFGGRRGT